MTLPTHIKVGPFDFAVRPISRELGLRLREDGDFDGESIHVTKGQRGPALADTVMHELLHAIFRTFALKDDDDEELDDILGDVLGNEHRPARRAAPEGRRGPAADSPRV